MNILLTGGSGLIGNELVKKLIDKGHKVRILTRDHEVNHTYYHWDKNKIDEKVFEDLDGIIHLAGAPLMKSWSTKFKKEIIDSRVETANLLLKYVKKLEVKLQFFISASGSSFYGQKFSDTIFNETANAGNDFLAEVCKLWEQAAYNFNEVNARVVCIRTPLVLAKNAESFKLMKLPTQYGLGASLGKGSQWSPWIHIDDLCEIYIKAVEDIKMEGSYNASASEQINHQDFMKKLASHLGSKIILPNIPAAFVKIGMGEKSSLILEGARLDNQKILDSGFKFKFETLDQAFEDIV
ncbi:MAG: TIGR01777 family oxidoreductase [Weeksellaceae bacterium]|nr:TIGR01777 family oxidoreductase [Weeksellaceae bacterium]